MKLLRLAALLLIAGCTTTTDLVPQVDYPHPPIELMSPPEPLETIKATSGIPANQALEVVTYNYAQCHKDEAQLKYLQDYIVQMQTTIDAYNKKVAGHKFVK